mgnify:CR=1 FL=1
MEIKILKSGEPYKSRKGNIIYDLTGKEIASVDRLPKILVSSIVKELRAGEEISSERIKGYFLKAAEIFKNGRPDGLDFEEYISKVHRASGIPYTSLQQNIKEVVEDFKDIPDYILTQIPKGAQLANQKEDEKNWDQCIIWIKKAEILSVISAGNNPLTHHGWLECLAAGYRVVVKPSVSEPFTAYRIVNSLYEAGLPKSYLAYLPGEHDLVDEIIDCSDFTIVYGGEQMVQQYGSNPKVIMRGPGRAKLFWDRDYLYLDEVKTKQAIIDSIVSGGGMKCVNTSGILYTEDHRESMKELCEELLAMNSKGLFDERGCLPIFPREKAFAFASYVKAFAEENQAELLTGSREIYEEIGEGLCIMRPSVLKIQQMNQNILNFEMGFPIVWIYEMKEESEISLLKHSLVLRLMTHDVQIKKKFCLDPTVKKVIHQYEQDNSLKNIPHDGYMLEHLFTAKGVC